MRAHVLCPTISRRRLQFGFGLVLLLGWEEHGEGLTDDLGLLVAGDAFRPEVPFSHPTSSVEQHDCVLLHALHEDTEPLLARNRRSFSRRRPGLTTLIVLLRHVRPYPSPPSE